MAEVLLENVSKVFPGGVTAVDDVSLRIADREFLVLVGPSGCGKSTTLRMIAGLEEVTRGTIRIGERDVTHVAPKDRDIAMVFQNYALYPHMTVYKNMAFGLMLRRQHAGFANPLAGLVAPARQRAARQERAEIDARVRSAASILGIQNLLNRKPRALSGGQRQRVAVGRAIVRNPKAFLFDEPLSNLDAKLRVEMRAELKSLHRKVQTTTIYVTHDQEEAMTLGDRVVVMKDGVIHQCGTPFEVYREPVNRFVAEFVGTPPMNFLSGLIRRDDGALWFEEQGGVNRLRVPEAQRGPLEGFVDRELVMGIRPEATRIGDGGEAGTMLRVDVDVVEPLGERKDVHCHTARHERFVCRLDADAPVDENASADVRVIMERAHFFEPTEEGRNLTLSDSRGRGG